MAETLHSAEGSPGYETRDIHVRPLVMFVVAFLAIAIVVQLLALWMFRVLDRQEATEKRASFSLAAGTQASLPREPRLEEIDRLGPRPELGIEERLAAQQATIEVYGATPEKGYVRIPIERAMELMRAQGKFPAHAPKPAPGKEAR
jgi:hypothetical protein